MRLPDERLCLKSILLRPFPLQSLNATAPWHFEKKKKNCLQKLSSPSPRLPPLFFFLLEEWSFAEVVFRLNSSERRGRRRRLSEELARLPRRRWSPCLAGCGSESPCVFLLVAVPVFGRDHLCVSSV